MALHVPKAPGMSQMLKDGARYFSGLEETVYRSISACKEFSQSLRTAYGPNGMNKMVINHLEKLFLTNDAATIIKELDVIHPAVKMIVLASEMQESEVGDGTNFVVIFAGGLLENADELLRLGITTSEIIEGYELALKEAEKYLENMIVYTVKDLKDISQIRNGVRTSVMSKQYGNEEKLTDLICQACVSALPPSKTFNVDNVRICKILGSGLNSSQVVQGMVLKRQVEGDVTKKTNAKIAVFNCAVDITQTETKGTVLIKSAEELLNFSKGEESLLETQIKAIADAGASVIVSGGSFGDMALHYMNKYNIMAVRIPSKFDLRRLCKTVKATALPKLQQPTKDELGFADHVYIDELGDTSVVIFKMDNNESPITTVVIRGSTDNYMDDIERAIDDGVNTYKGITTDPRFLPGAGAVEVRLASEISAFAHTLPGLDQYAVRKFATALELFPKTIADNSGTQASELLSKLYAAHKEGKTNYGFDIEGSNAALIDTEKAGIIDLYRTKLWGLRYGTNAACTVLKVNEIIMAKRAGGPKLRGGKGNSDDES